jgi:polar amino acid transport system permease protein
MRGWASVLKITRRERMLTGAESPAGGDDAALATRRRHPLYWLFLLIVALFAAQVVVFLWTNPRLEWSVVAQYFFASAILHGIETTIGLTAICTVIGLVIGVAVGLARLSSFGMLRRLAFAYTWLFRSIPVLVQLLFWYNLGYLVPKLSIGIPFGPSLLHGNANQLISALTAAIVGFSLHEGACSGELIRSGILAVDPGQIDAGKALGLRASTTFRRVTLPQAARIILPPLGTQVITLLKGTSLVSVIALSDLLFSVENIYGINLEIVPLLLVASLWYVIIVALLSIGQSMLERVASRGYSVRADRTTLKLPATVTSEF